MPDPRVLYVVSAVVVLGLATWVAGVLTLAEPLKKREPSGAGETPPPASGPRPWLRSHAEIQDDPGASPVDEPAKKNEAQTPR